MLRVHSTAWRMTQLLLLINLLIAHRSLLCCSRSGPSLQTHHVGTSCPRARDAGTLVRASKDYLSLCLACSLDVAADSSGARGQVGWYALCWLLGQDCQLAHFKHQHGPQQLPQVAAETQALSKRLKPCLLFLAMHVSAEGLSQSLQASRICKIVKIAEDLQNSHQIQTLDACFRREIETCFALPGHACPVTQSFKTHAGAMHLQDGEDGYKGFALF